MHKIDIIIPFYVLNQKLSIRLYKWKPDWFPVWYNQKRIKKKGVQVRFFTLDNLRYKKLSNIVCIDSKIIHNFNMNIRDSKTTRNDLLVNYLKKIKKRVNSLVFFDTKDGTNIIYKILPYVDRYYKKQLLKDRTIYSKNLSRGRLYTDFYASNYNIRNTNFNKSKKLNVFYEEVENFKYNSEKTEAFNLYSKYKKKISLSWNIALSDYHLYNNDLIKYAFSKIKKKIKFYKPNLSRKFVLSANFNTKYSSDLISFQRKQLLKILKEKYKSNPMISLGNISRKDYLRVLKASQAIISPFGWGEICYRDFETFVSGACLIKPDLDHLESWPSLYKKYETYIPISWKIEDWDNSIEEILADKKNLLEIAKNGQNLYKNLWTKKGMEKFSDYFIDLIKDL